MEEECILRDGLLPDDVERCEEDWHSDLVNK